MALIGLHFEGDNLVSKFDVQAGFRSTLEGRKVRGKQSRDADIKDKARRPREGRPLRSLWIRQAGGGIRPWCKRRIANAIIWRD